MMMRGLGGRAGGRREPRRRRRDEIEWTDDDLWLV